jgi:hypothetical protein
MADPSRVQTIFWFYLYRGLAPTAIVVSSLQDEDGLILNEYYFNPWPPWKYIMVPAPDDILKLFQVDKSSVPAELLEYFEFE